MKGCLVIVGFLLVSAVLAVGAVIVVERVGAARNEPLTAASTQVEFVDYEPETHRGGGGNSQSIIDGANVTYRYEADGRWFETTDPVWRPLTDLSDRVVCFDPDDPAEHVLRGDPEAECGERNFGKVRRAEAVAP
jgi:hypothetical protein